MGEFFSNIHWGGVIFATLIGLGLALFVTMRREAKNSLTVLSEEEFTANMRKGQLIDIRKKEDFDRGHINGARNIPAATITRNIGKIRSDLPVYLYCEKGKSCKRIAVFLNTKGINNIYQLDGGLENWTGGLKTKK